MQLDRPRSISIGVEGEQFLTEKLNLGCSQLTYRTYGDRLRWYGEFLTSIERELGDTSIALIHAWISEQRTRGWSPKMIRDNISVLRVLFKWLEDNEIIAKDPIRKLPPLHVPRRLPDVLQEPDVQQLLEAAINLRPLDLAIVELFYGSMIRTGELCALNLLDVNLRGRLAKIRGKGRKDRYVPISEAAANAIAAWLPVRDEVLGGKTRRAQAAALRDQGLTYKEIGKRMGIAPCVAVQYVAKWRRRPTPAPGATSALFVTRHGRVGPEYVRSVVHKVAKATKLARRVHPHLFRHSGSTHMLDHGADIRYIRDMLGHESIATTEIYTHVSIAQLRRVYELTHPRSKISVTPPTEGA